MNKEQQIEEMARVACEHFDRDMVGQPCTKCKTYDKHCYTIHQAEALYNAGYRKTFTSDFASDTQKAYKEGYIKGIEETEAEMERLKAQLSEFEKPVTQFVKDREAKAVKKFAEWAKDHIADVPFCNQKAYNVFCDMVNEKLKEYEK